MKYSIPKAEEQNGKISLNDIIRSDDRTNSRTPGSPGLGFRHLQSLLLALCVFSGYLQRVNLSVTIVAIAEDENNSVIDETILKFPRYSWDNTIRGYLHSAFFVGYFIMNIPAAVLGAYFNNKQLLFLTFFINGFFSFVTPIIINYNYNGDNDFLRHLYEYSGPGNWKAVIVIRVIQGLLQAFMFPTIHAIIARWAPPNERSQLGGFIMSGIPFGTMVTLVGSGILSTSGSGWPTVFYVSGIIGIGWSILWWIFGSNSPTEHKTISQLEYTYICNSIMIDSSSNKKKSTKIPWKSMLTSWQVWAIIVVHTGHNWGFWLLLSEMPTFMHSVLGYNIKADGLLSAVPYLCMWVLQIPVMYIADNFNKRKITSITVSRKIWTSIGMWGASISLVILGYLDDDKRAALILYVCSVTIGCANNVGFNINHMDLSPNYAGILMGLSNGFAATGGLGAPLLVAYIVNDVKSVLQWRQVFFAGALITFSSNLFFVIFASGRTQSWNEIQNAE